MFATDPTDAPWRAVETLVRSVIDLEASAAETGAFRQARGVPSAAVLLRLCLASEVCRLSLRQTCAWAAEIGVARLSNPAWEKRFQNAGGWLGEIAGALLAARAAVPPRWPGYQLRLVDATALSVPGASGTSWRLHLSYDLGRGCMCQASLTDGHGGERLGRFAPPLPGTVVLADAGYPHPRELRGHLAAGGDLIGRTSWAAARLLTPAGGRFDLFDALRRLDGPAGAWDVVVDDHQPALPPLHLRLVAGRKPAAACEQARRRVRETAKRKGKTPDARSLEAADWVLLLTSLPAAAFDAAAVLAAYRLRWQVELAIKRWKTLLGLGEVPVRTPATATAWIYAMLIAALLIEDKVARAATQFPPGQPAHAAGVLPVAHVRALGPQPVLGSVRAIPLAVA
ncbi:transposase [Azospirillum largimobile]